MRSAEPGQTQVFFRSCSVFVFEFGRNFPQMSCYCTSPLVQTIHLSTAPGQQNIVHQEYCKNCTVLTSGIARWRDGGLGRVPREGLQPGPWTKVWIISFIHSHKCIRKAPENENNAYVTAEIVYLHIYKIYFGSEISKWGPSAINREFGILDCWHAIRGAPRRGGDVYSESTHIIGQSQCKDMVHSSRCYKFFFTQSTPSIRASGRAGTLLASMAALPLWRSTASLPHRCEMASPSSCPVCRAAPSLFTSLFAPSQQLLYQTGHLSKHCGS